MAWASLPPQAVVAIHDPRDASHGPLPRDRPAGLLEGHLPLGLVHDQDGEVAHHASSRMAWISSMIHSRASSRVRKRVPVSSTEPKMAPLSVVTARTVKVP